MPFTFSHPAIVLPLTFLPKKWFSLTGLVIGSMTPDFEYFLRMRIISQHGHTMDGLFWFDIPLGVLLAFVFHNIVRDSLFDNLPYVLKSRFSVFKRFNWTVYFKENWLIVILSLLIGAASHIFWDGFTHFHGFFVQRIPALSNTLDLFGRSIPVLKILQHTSTLIGALIICFSIFKMPKNTIQTEIKSGKYWLIVTGLTLAVIALRFVICYNSKSIGSLIVITISAGLLSLVITPLILRKRAKATSDFQ